MKNKNKKFNSKLLKIYFLFFAFFFAAIFSPLDYYNLIIIYIVIFKCYYFKLGNFLPT